MSLARKRRELPADDFTLVGPGQGPRFERDRDTQQLRQGYPPEGETGDFYGGLTHEFTKEEHDIIRTVHLNSARAYRNNRALRLLGDLFEKRILPADKKRKFTWDEQVALGMLAGGLFCEIDSEGMRITDRGAQLVQELIINEAPATGR